MAHEPITEEGIRLRVRHALDKLLEEDSYLFIRDVNERSISHKLGSYLQDQFQGWHVDCEYNRNHDDVKRLNFTVEAVFSDDTEGNTVYPDIIVHRRDTDDNLLVVEIKKTTNPKSKDQDIRKLTAFKAQLGYHYALFIRLLTGQATARISEEEWV